ncbi:unnamed protein product [Blepharisma stoltei]|uniref:Uncharacterized protein n=1 Tax=Blepharisma stoltei TaxID=1481888 RepID=A0AAU9IVB7_9CILI|nr:unnamed protein product [Blepharisma stoltei]
MSISKAHNQFELKSELDEITGSRRSVAESRKESRPASSTNKKRRKVQTVNTIDLENKLLELQEQLEDEKSRSKDLQAKITERQERYVKREQEYRRTIADYETKLRQGAGEKPLQLLETTGRTLEKINNYQGQILNKIGTIQLKTTHLLQDQEKEIVRDFNVMLNNKTKELEEEKRKKVLGIGSYSQKESRLMEELDMRKASVEIIENKNKLLHKKNSELKIEFKAHENDQFLLEKELNEAREKNKKLKNELSKARENSISVPQEMQAQTAGFDTDYRSEERLKYSPSRASDIDLPNRYESIIQKLKRMLELERKNLRAARTAYARELESKRELETLIRQCVDDVKSHITKKRAEQRIKGPDSSPDDIEKVIEVLLSQERVLTLLYDKTFPPRSVAKEPYYSDLDSKNMMESIDHNIESIQQIYTKHEEEIHDTTERAKMEF